MKLQDVLTGVISVFGDKRRRLTTDEEDKITFLVLVLSPDFALPSVSHEYFTQDTFHRLVNCV